VSAKGAADARFRQAKRQPSALRTRGVDVVEGERGGSTAQALAAGARYSTPPAPEYEPRYSVGVELAAGL
jgi:hypothetical protein